MSMNTKKSVSGTILLIALGLITLFAGPKLLPVLIPVAMLIWFGARPALRTGRN
jgi:hypothetical protein